MRHSLLSIFIFITILLFLAPLGSSAQQVVQQLGGAESDTWDALSPALDSTCTVFALGYPRETQVDGQLYTAPGRGVVLGCLSDTESTVWGNLTSRGNTRVHNICPSPQGRYVFGNAFSFLVYQGDTLISTNGRNNAFVMQLDTLGNLEKLIHLNSEGAVLGQAALWHRESNTLLTLFQIRDTLQWDNQNWAPRATTASLLMRWSPELNLQWATLIDGTGEIEGTHLKSIEDELYIAGRFKGQISGQTDTIFTPTADFDGFIYAASTQGTERFIRHLRGQFQDDVFALEVNAAAVFFGGQFIGNLRLQNIEILTGLQVAGYLGAMDREGNALWMHPVRGSSISLAVTAIHPTSDEVNWAIRTGEITTFQGETLQQPTSVAQVHSIRLRTDQQGEFKAWQLWPGNPIIYITDFLWVNDNLRVAGEMMGQFAGTQSRGFFDALLIDPSSSTSTYIEYTVPQALKLYPQPARNQLCVNLIRHNWKAYQLISLSGQLIQQGSFEEPCLDISQLPPGPYVIRLIPPHNQPPIQQLWIKQ